MLKLEFLPIFVCLFAVPTFGDGAKNTQSQPKLESGWEVMAGSEVAAKHKALLDHFSNLEKDAPDKDRPLYKKFFKTTQQDNSTNSLLGAQEQLLTGLQRLHPEEVDVQVPLVTQLYMLGLTMRHQKGLEGKGKRIQETAEKDTRELIRKHPDNARLYHLLGDMHLHGGRVSDAKAAFEKCLTLDPKKEECRSGLASLNLKTPSSN